MSELSRLVWRHQAGYMLREHVRDCFLEQAERLRTGMRNATNRLRSCHEIQEAAVRKEAAFDLAIRALERAAQQALFAEALEAVKRAEFALETMDDICDACAAMERARDQLSRLHEGLRGLHFPAIKDYDILTNRSREFFRNGEFRVAGFIAEETLRGLERLTMEETGDRPCPPYLRDGIERQNKVAVALGELGFASFEADLMRRGIEVVQKHIESRRFGLAAALLGDIDTANAPVETFVMQKRLAEQLGMQESLNKALATLKRHDQRSATVWRSVTMSLLEDSLKWASLRMGRRALTASANQ